ncbi:hypothetical protein CHS0354_020699 [Potamilus streckersoni]|uniref:B box-type domain-containing protein n=1 Tax=Potamilus streckersoni TaxID=2493646 RepID=A0AAE0TFH9_9BIVA|nr:hypothetical protein CHS0354_020699 [Potamilus streckersoni]
MAKENATFNMEELEHNSNAVMELKDCVTCSKHHGEDIKYFCKDHDFMCCGVCYSEGHNTCLRVLDLQTELSSLLYNNKPDDIFGDLKQIEIHLKKFMELNEVILDRIVAQINTSTDQIRVLKKKINDVLDEIEKVLKAEKSRICKEEEIKKEKENQQCSSILSSVTRHLYILKIADTYGSDAQKFLTTEKVRSQLRSYINLVREKYETIGTVSIKADLLSSIQSILSVSVSELGKLMSTVDYIIIPITYSQSHAQYCQVKAVSVIKLQVPALEPTCYTDIAFFPGDRLLAVDYVNQQCILISSSYQFIASCPLPPCPWNICVLDNQEVAVSFLYGNIIHILSVVGNVIRPARVIPTKYNCNGIAYAGNGTMVVNWYNATLRSEWSLINMRGEVIHSHVYDSPCSPYNYYNRYLTLNNAKTRVIISADAINSLLCFDMDGNRLFTYKADNLVEPKGVVVDRHDNIYVIGHVSKNIHLLSPNGYIIQEVTDEMRPVIPGKTDGSFRVSMHGWMDACIHVLSVLLFMF